MHENTHAGGVRTSDAREVLFARHSLVTHAKAFGVDAIDLVETDFKSMLVNSLHVSLCIPAHYWYISVYSCTLLVYPAVVALGIFCVLRALVWTLSTS